MYALSMTLFIASGLALVFASLQITSLKSFLILARIACAVGAVTGVAFSVSAADLSIPGKFVVTIAGAASAAVTMLVVGLARKSSISKQRQFAPEVTRFLRFNFRKLAISDASGTLTITRQSLQNAMERYEGDALKTLQHVAAHFKDIGHSVRSEFIPMPVSQGVGSGPGSVDGFLYEIYAIELKDVDTYIQNLSTMYDGW